MRPFNYIPPRRANHRPARGSARSNFRQDEALIEEETKVQLIHGKHSVTLDPSPRHRPGPAGRGKQSKIWVPFPQPSGPSNFQVTLSFFASTPILPRLRLKRPPVSSLALSSPPFLAPLPPPTRFSFHHLESTVPAFIHPLPSLDISQLLRSFCTSTSPSTIKMKSSVILAVGALSFGAIAQSISSLPACGVSSLPLDADLPVRRRSSTVPDASRAGFNR